MTNPILSWKSVLFITSSIVQVDILHLVQVLVEVKEGGRGDVFVEVKEKVGGLGKEGEGWRLSSSGWSEGESGGLGEGGGRGDVFFYLDKKTYN